MSSKKLAILTAMAAAMSGNYTSGKYDYETPITYTPKTKEELEAEKIAYYKRKGLKEWNINGRIVWAATKKAAIKKAGFKIS